ncbi:DUF4268 domain-containing protein [Phaeobacter inhibens]|uniref:DUF4268 domain-containing protein n=1 Tax=Phaeobacter inhibens TaxID=221822 RepID=UPI0021A878D2|nr:DUF4268 domain-containing protein [Phaeobacter inhibens]UWR64815.1 DUF4268 domain-containing protein [Phaeobacter inhibens]
MADLGKLERVDLRSEWIKEDRDFTPWLAREENISLLGETLNMSLEVEQEERRVGRFSADILCRDTATADGDWVVIENQLETTDHSHLGQVITYAAGLEAKTCIWVAAKFHEEHRAAIDWLNEITGDGLQFFALEIELWRIGDSLSAPKFNIVAQPNDWKRDVGRAAKNLAEGTLNETKQLQLAFWEGVNERISQNRVLRPRKPSPKQWMDYSVGRTGFVLRATISTQNNRVGAALYIQNPDAQAQFEQLLAMKDEIDGTFGLTLDWDPLPSKQACKISTDIQAAGISDRSSWPKLQSWLVATLEEMYSCFAPKVRVLEGEV